jgi:heat-inducible transcriptional repressor
MAEDLTDRERTVLHYIVHDFIETAAPIGSRYISRRHEEELGLSSASIRNIMSDLEYLGYIGHPHTSAGRVPTDLGYRFYLNRLMKLEAPSAKEVQAIRENIDSTQNLEDILQESSRVLGKISHQLSLVTSPELSSGTFEKLELIQIVSNRIMVIISIKSGLVRTIMMEVGSTISREKLEDLARLLNERLGGLTLQQIRESFADRLKDAQDEQTGLIRLFIDSVDKLFIPPRMEKLHVGGTEKLVEQPEFANPREFRSIIELVNDEEFVIHVLQKLDVRSESPNVSVGRENPEDKLKNYSVIRTTYSVGDVAGTVGVIGPTRMPYNRMIPLVDYVAKMITDMFSTTKQA